MRTLALYRTMSDPLPAAAPTALQAGLEDRFVEAHLTRIFRQIYRMVGNVHDAQDLTQEVFIKALQRRDQIRGLAKDAHWRSRLATDTPLRFLRPGRPALVLHNSQRPSA